MKLRAIMIAFALIALGIPSTSAATTQLSLTVRQTPSASEALITFYGAIKPAKSGVAISIQINTAGKWKSTLFKTKTAKAGTWKVSALATALNAKVSYRASALTRGKKIYSPTRSITIKQVVQISETDPALVVGQFGPGGRIHGADVSRWQHPNEKPIDFVKMYDAGVRFVMIKASDTKDTADALALKYLVMDHSAAQAAGIYTGFYHYATLPDVTDDAAIIQDATAQAQKVMWRLASIGGYTERDLPYALDLENKCVRLSSSGTCLKNASQAQVTLWARTFLGILKAKTGKTPMVYSYSSFLEGSMARTAELTQYPLWLAQYAIDPADPLNQPGLKAGGCYVHSWTSAACATQWTMWQYTSCGIAPKYGVPGARLDLSVFRGDAQAFMALVAGSWVPAQVDLMPVNEPTVLTIENLLVPTTSNVVTFKVSVARPDSTPVVTGGVKLVLDAISTPSEKPTQTQVRATSGAWTLSVKGLPVGTYVGKIQFNDVSGTHAQSSQPVSFAVVQAPAPTPTPTPSSTPTPKPTIAPTPKPSVDSCANQIKN